jgi:hypothetical protein
MRPGTEPLARGLVGSSGAPGPPGVIWRTPQDSGHLTEQETEAGVREDWNPHTPAVSS